MTERHARSPTYCFGRQTFTSTEAFPTITAGRNVDMAGHPDHPQSDVHGQNVQWNSIHTVYSKKFLLHPTRPKLATLLNSFSCVYLCLSVAFPLPPLGNEPADESTNTLCRTAALCSLQKAGSSYPHVKSKVHLQSPLKVIWCCCLVSLLLHLHFVKIKIKWWFLYQVRVTVHLRSMR